MLILYGLLLKQLDLSVCSVQFDFVRLNVENLIFEVGFGLQEFLLALGMLSDFFFVSINPHVSCLFLSLNDLVQRLDFVCRLLLNKLQLSF